MTLELHTTKLRDGSTFPTFAFGTGTTFKGQHGPIVEAALNAWEAGFRHFDTAWVYKTEKALGEAFKILMQEKGVKREEIFVSSKVSAFCWKYEEAIAYIESSLANLGLDYVDMMMPHGPGPYLNSPITNLWLTPEQVEAAPRTAAEGREGRVAVWRALQDMKAKGKIQQLGVSNFNRRQLADIMEDPRCYEKPSVLQMELHPYYWDRDMYRAGRENGLLIQAFSPLGNGNMEARKRFHKEGEDSVKKVLEDPYIASLSRRHSCTPAQICLSWLINSKGAGVVTKTANVARMTENLEAVKVELSIGEMEKVDDLTELGQQIFLDSYKVV